MRLTGPTGLALEPEFLENQMTVSLTGHEDRSQDVRQVSLLTPGQTEVVLDVARVSATTARLNLTVSGTCSLLACLLL